MNLLSASRSAWRCLETRKVSRWPTNGDRATARSCRPTPVQLAPSTNDDEGPLRGEGAAEAGEKAVPADVEDQVIAIHTVGEVLLRVVDDMVGADGADEIDLPSAAHAGDLRSEGFRKLHRAGSDASGGPDNQHLLARLDVPGLQTLNGGQPGDCNDCSLLEADSGWFVDELVLSGGRVLGEGPPSDAEHLVARPEPGHAGSHLDDRASDVQPWDALLRTAEAEADDPHQVGLAR